jgi:hypothetical protein
MNIQDLINKAFVRKPTRAKAAPGVFSETINKGGYRVIRVNGVSHLEHRLVMENWIGRKIKKDEHIHHKDGDKLNNRIDNLILLTSKEHATLHRRQVKWLKLICPSCKRTRIKKVSKHLALEAHTHRVAYCNKQCYEAKSLGPK